MIQVYDEKKHCSGCTACENVCPVHAISMQTDEKGFLYPVIDNQKCVDCGKCVRTCPIMNKEDAKDGWTVRCIAMRLLDNEALIKSSSGGVAYGLALWFLNHGGVVYGAAYDEENKVSHVRVESTDEIGKLQGSKYVQSDIRGIYAEVKEDLEGKREVLFISTGCQVAGLQRYLGKGFDNLLTCDVICYGAPSPMLWERYLKETVSKYVPCTVNMRDKAKGWANPCYSFSRNGKILKQDKMDRSSYLRLFLWNYGLREACFDCAFKTHRHCSDLTLGDCWGMDHLVQTKSDDGLGMSMVFINSQKGQDVLEACQECFWEEEINTEEAIKTNPMLIRSVVAPKDENAFWKMVGENTLQKTAFTVKPDDPPILKLKKRLYPLKKRLFGN